MDTTPHEWMCLASRTEKTHTQKKGRIFYFIFILGGGRLLLNVSVLVTSGLITSKTGCVPEEEEGFFISTLSFCQCLRGKIDAAGWFTSWNPLLPLKSLKTLLLSGELLFYFPKFRLLLYMREGKKREWTLFFPSLLSPSFFFPHDWADLTMWSQRN